MSMPPSPALRVGTRLRCTVVALTVGLLLNLNAPARAAEGGGPTTIIRLFTQNAYVPGIPVLVRVEAYGPDGTRNRDTWDSEAILSVSPPGIVLSTNRLVLRNGLGSALIDIPGGGDFTLTASIEGISASRQLVSVAGVPVSTIGGILPGTSTVWSNVINVTNSVTVPVGHTLTILSNTLVLINGVASGSSGAGLLVRGRVQSLGTEEQPVTFTSASSALHWGEIRHTNSTLSASALSIYKHTIVTRAGRSPATGHTGTGPAFRLFNSSNYFESCTVSDLVGKSMYASGSDVVFTNSQLARSIMGPEVTSTAVKMISSWITEMHGSPTAPQGTNDNDGIYFWGQQAGQEITMRDCVLADAQDDGVDTLNANVTITNCIIRDCNNPAEDAKGISGFDSIINIQRCLVINNVVGISMKTSAGAVGRVNISDSTINGTERAIAASWKDNAPGPIIDFRVTNSILNSVDPIYTDFGPTNFTIGYCVISEPWPGTGNITSDPLFVNGLANNFRLRPTSPCIDSGNPAAAADADGTRADIGYYSFLVNPDPLLAAGSAWRYLDDGSDQGTAWREIAFDDSSWPSGLAQFGYGDGDEATVVGFGPNAASKYVATYFRKAFTVLNPSEFSAIEARVLVDDGAVIYLNGQELFRPNIAAGPLAYNTLSGGNGENSLFTNMFAPSLLVAGTNVIAAEVHQFTLDSSDISFDFGLRGIRASGGNGAPSVAIGTPADGTTFSAPADVPISASATDADGLITNLAVYANAQLLSQTPSPSVSFTWNSVFEGTYTLIAIATDNSGSSSTSAPVRITIAAPSTSVTNVLIAIGSNWRFFDKGMEPGVTWSQRAFNDSGWSNGLAPLGYCVGGCSYALNTSVVSYGPDAANKFPATYFRHAFMLEDAARVEALRLTLLRDDGAVVYINGNEVHRVNMPPGTITDSTYAASASNYTPEQTALPVEALNALVSGTNVLAISIHQGSPGSSDIVLEAQLEAVMAAITNQKPVVNITAPLNDSTYPAPLTMTISANAVDLDGAITNVSFFVNGSKLTDDMTAPYSAAWNNVPAGVYNLTASAHDATGLGATSAVVVVSVSTNTAAPVVFGKAPTPGNVTSLGQVTVTFSKRVTGVDAGDLLLNGSPATNVTAAGSNYLFTFPQPAYGAVQVTWNAGHGITDAFTPPVAFSAASAGANWTYQLLDTIPPAIVGINPTPGSTVAALSGVEVTFSEPVTGVSASDLLINQTPAAGVTGAGAGPYTFSFPQPGQGTVNIIWSAAHGVQDFSANAFAATPWSYTLDTNSSGVVISEIMYHPASENVLEEYMELHNKGGAAVGLNGWKFSGGVSFTFSNTVLPAGGYLVVAADIATFTNKYPGVTNVVGGWEGVLNNDGESIDLDDARGEQVCSVSYADEGDWAVRQRGRAETISGFTHRGWTWFKPHDGMGRSLELINPQTLNDSGQNWAASAVTNGTPGRINSVFQNNVAPLILETTHFPTIPTSTDTIIVSARILDETAGGLSIALSYRVDSANPPPFTTVPMSDDGANGDTVANDGIFAARILPQANNAVVEYYITAGDSQGRTRTWPGPAIAAADGAGPIGQVVNALLQVDDTTYAGTNAQPVYKVIMTENERAELAVIPSQSNLQGPNAQMNATFISIDGAGVQRHYNVGIRNRGHGSRSANPPNYHVNFRSDDAWKGLVAVNFNAVQVHLQHFGSSIARLSGAVGGAVYAAQVRINNVNRAASGSPMFGSYAVVEEINQNFADHHFPADSDGNLYRAVRDISPPDFAYRTTAAFPGLYGPEDKRSYTNTWTKLNNGSEDDWTDLIGMLRVMGVNNATPFTTQSAREVVNVEQWLTHLAVMNLLGNAETGLNSGYNDDYAMYRGALDTRFQLLYWDLDQILGVNSMAANSSIFSMTANNGAGAALNRLVRWPEFEPIYYGILQNLINTSFSQSQFNATIDSTLGGYVPASSINAIKSWMNSRRSYVQGVLPALPVGNAPIATIAGTPRSPTPFSGAQLTVGSADVAAYRYSLNGSAYAAEQPISVPISLASLPAGTNTIAVIGKGTNGVWQEITNATVRAWIVDASVPPVRLNEVLARNVGSFNHSGSFPDAIELYNEGVAPVDLGGLRLSDDKGAPNKFTFPPNTLLNPGAYLVVYANNADGTPGIHLGFSLDADGDSLHLFASVASGGALLDSIRFGRQLADLSFGRVGAGGDWLLTQPSLGSANVLQLMGTHRALRINEWLSAGQSQPDFVELFNTGSLPVSLSGLSLTDSPLGDPARNPFDTLNFIGADEFVAFTADGTGDGRTMLNFKLALEHGEIGLMSSDLGAIDQIVYGPQQPEITQGRCPDGASGYASLATPTPGAPNACPVAPPAPQTISLVSITNTWKYDVSGADPGSTWMTASYNDNAWLSGGALLFAPPQRAYSLPEPVNTILPHPANIVTYYFRTRFTVPAATTLSALQFSHVVDDGAVFYLNGVEIGRYNLPSGPIDRNTLATGVTDAGYVGPIAVSLTNLVSGENVVAVELHQNSATSADLAFGLKVEGLIVTNSPALAGVILNEVFANNATFEEPDGARPDWVEIFNPSLNAVDLSGMSLTDSTLQPRRWSFPAPSILNAGGFMRVRFDPDLPASSTNAGFGLKANGGSVYLFNRPADGGSLASSITHGLQAADFSIGRVPDGSTNWQLNVPTLGSANIPAAVGLAGALRINEWMASPASGEDYFELFNPAVQPVDISRFYLTDDLSLRTKHRLPPLSFIGVGQDAFLRFEADDNSVAGADHVNFKLGAGGEALGLTSASGVPIDSVSFGPQTAGVSQGRLPDGAANIVSFASTPTPGKSNFLPLGNLLINELLSHSDLPLEDAVEFYNPTGDDVDISGWYLSDSQNNLLKYRIPAGAVVRAGGYFVLYEYQFNGDAASDRFSFSSAKGDEVYLSQSITPGVLTGYRAFALFGAAANGVSFGRFRTSAGDDFTAMSVRTFGVDDPASTNQFRLGQGATNAYPKISSVVINEIMYHPAVSNDALEFVELRNVSATPVPLYDTANPANTWRLRKGVDFNFAQGASIPAGSYLVVVSFDPATDLVSRSAFESAYGSGITLVGPYAGKLDNAGEPVELQSPDSPETTPGPDFGFVPYIVADRVVYSDRGPWPVSPDGFGASLKKVDSSRYGNEPLNWAGGAPTPGAANFVSATNGAPLLGAIANRSVHVGYSVGFSASATDPDLPGQVLGYTLEGAVAAGASIDSLTGAFAWSPQPDQLGTYSFTVRVTDNGSPALSDTTSFSISVLSLPQVSSMVVASGNIDIRWVSHPGRRYQIETTSNLTSPDWTPVGTAFVASSTLSSVTLLGGTEGQRFYRVVSFDD